MAAKYTTIPVEKVEVGDPIRIGGREGTKTVKAIVDNGTAFEFEYETVAPWGPCKGRFVVLHGETVKVEAAA